MSSSGYELAARADTPPQSTDRTAESEAMLNKSKMDLSWDSVDFSVGDKEILVKQHGAVAAGFSSGLVIGGVLLIGHQATAGFQPAEQIGLFPQRQNRCRVVAVVTGERRVETIEGAHRAHQLT